MTRIRIGLFYSYDTEWIGGSYYKTNLVNAFNLLEDDKKPEFVILSNKENYEKLVEETQYPYLSYWELGQEDKYHKWERIVNKIARPFLKKNLIDKRINFKQVDILFPNPPDNYSYELVKHKLYWIPDFQEAHLPQFFGETELKNRAKTKGKVAESTHPILLSSQDAKKDFDNIYPSSKIKKYVIPFAVTHPNLNSVDISSLIHKYKIPEKYFFCANQIWIHKNHITVLKALALLKSKGITINVLFSGKNFDPRYPKLFNELLAFSKENGIKEQVFFLGFIDRKDQLVLMKNAVSILQPSLFEGWSTVIEDSKALNQFTIASNLNVHKEQLNLNYEIVEAKNEIEMAAVMHKYWEMPPNIVAYDYKKDISDFANSFLETVHDIISNK